MARVLDVLYQSSTTKTQRTGCMRTEEAITAADNKVPGAHRCYHPDANVGLILTINR